MSKLEQINKKLKPSEENHQELKKELRHKKNENLDSYFALARATEEELQQMANKVETTDKEREKHIKRNMEEIKRRYETVNEKLWSLETRLDTMNRDQAESSCAIQAKLDALLRNSFAQEKTVSDKTEKVIGARFDFVEPQRKKQESTTLPQINNNKRSGISKTAMKGGVPNSARIPRDSRTHTSVTPDAMTWANTWEMMNRTLEAFATRNTALSDREGGKQRKIFMKPEEFKDDSYGFIDTWVEVLRLHLDQDILNDERRGAWWPRRKRNVTRRTRFLKFC